jgi:hypothetical protein
MFNKLWHIRRQACSGLELAEEMRICAAGSGTVKPTSFCNVSPPTEEASSLFLVLHSR